jgi:hypothetical protein
MNCAFGVRSAVISAGQPERDGDEVPQDLRRAVPPEHHGSKPYDAPARIAEPIGDLCAHHVAVVIERWGGTSSSTPWSLSLARPSSCQASSAR